MCISVTSLVVKNLSFKETFSKPFFQLKKILFQTLRLVSVPQSWFGSIEIALKTGLDYLYVRLPFPRLPYRTERPPPPPPHVTRRFTAKDLHLEPMSSPGLVVMGDDSCLKGCGWKSRHHILVGRFSYWFVVKIVLFCLKRPKINERETGVWPIF